jgi:hypothetical protein
MQVKIEEEKALFKKKEKKWGSGVPSPMCLCEEHIFIVLKLFLTDA